MILLSFDVEEFDLPTEYGRELPFSEQLSISTEGTLAILDMLRETGVKASFFVTAHYAVNQPDVISQIVNDGHELASHGYYHSSFSDEHLLQSKLVLEKLSGTTVKGFRMARMMPVNLAELNRSGYVYNSSINPTWVPGRYNHFDKPRTWFFEQDILQLPSSVSPLIRFPLFWLSFHNLPVAILNWLSLITYRKDKYLNIYFHPWEFTNLKHAELGLPAYISRNSGDEFIARIKSFIRFSQKKGLEFGTISQFTDSYILKNKSRV
ncbi:polysaccharide deacetylase family protein [Mucilaginibacter sp. SP1R1]|uniref:polysaccharide deacetylase family protein n=1 Tax=Mucilaginibacter sp. SP1R1 TaxID=2723091 RepID=UPI0016098A63|nr:polysaccharide deacetylase family protein [Mucilaginibacter sp. SP1R1]MBB6148550.1 peptidoglycan/xylan/chitin deacetylase (PgdA/CDA1 family) [Mucilaginibacter sp. SP1R1]